MQSAAPTIEQQLFQENLALNRLEYQGERIHLWSRPRCLGIVLGNACNLNCLHCYQAKNGDHLLRPVEIGRQLRREFAGFYPYLSTLDILGGEVLALPGFDGLVEDLRAAVTRPILSISTNGTLLDDAWAQRMVRTPFLCVTVSIDGARPETMAKLRGGADLDVVLGGVRRIREWKRRLASELPRVNAFFVIMRSNFREIPAFLRLMRENGMFEVALQTLEINGENARRAPALERDEAISAPDETRELHTIVRDALRRERPRFRMIRVSGLHSLFAGQGLETEFLREQQQGLYPDSDDPAGENGFECCPNPWTTLFIDESGNAFLCFLSEPIGNVYEAPLAAIWNSPRAAAKRSHIIAGRYLASGCSKQWCSWRDGRAAPARDGFENSLAAFTELSRRALGRQSPAEEDQPVAAVRRVMREKNQCLAELQGMFQELCQINREVHETGRRHIDALEERLRQAEALRRSPLVRAAERLSRGLAKLRLRQR